MKKTEYFTREAADQEWYVVDARDKVLGRIATKVADVLRGKNKPTFTPNADIGGYVIVVNADKVKLTGKKMAEKTYYRHTGFMGGLKSTTPEKVLASKHPERLVEWAVRGMLPKTRLGDRLFTKLKVYAGPDHPHKAQQPKALAVNE
ncbi:MAG: 50S ribosomal protein L13 [Deltaproteobacteria bacterium]|nr:50S ribosomal protein L13 [Deltaproteobacteria bacterium]PWB65537.1 MAG: 50S ribosomal protein L13 [Deltaproteobacteria bacterium]